ncbi:MAG: phospholipase [Gemmatimonadetes bacterium]|nr:phospholipase [Gemmatimonadota bacterium]
MIEQHHLSVSRTARYYTIGKLGEGIRDVWFVCHGYAQLAGAFARRFETLAAPRRLVVAPEALSRFYLGDHVRPAGPDAKIGASWMTREDRDIDIRDYVDYLDTLYDHVFRRARREGARVHVLGFSQGTATVSRWVVQGRARVDRLVLWGGPFAPEADFTASHDRLARIELVLVIGSEDHYVTPKVRAAEEQRLHDAGLSFRVVEYAGGHEIDPGALGALAGG